MPFLVVVADMVKEGIMRGPTFLGDENLDPVLVEELQGEVTVETEDDDGNLRKDAKRPGMLETDFPVGQVLTILEAHKYTISYATNCDNSIVYTLHKPKSRAKKSMAATGTATKNGTRSQTSKKDGSSRESSVADQVSRMKVSEPAPKKNSGGGKAPSVAGSKSRTKKVVGSDEE